MTTGLALGALAALLAASNAPDLAGIWHVLIHYQDANAHDPDQWRWDDRVWVFEQKDGALRWTEYPIAVFEDESGRFESLGTNTASRVPGKWTPSAGQLAQIHDRIEVNPRGKKAKALAARAGGEWRSEPSSENWLIQGPPGQPVFEQVVGPVDAGGLATRYVSETFDAETGEIRGSFERDASRRGSFRMLRSNAEQLGGTRGGALFASWAKAFGQSLVLRGGGEIAGDDRAAARAAIRVVVERDMRGRRLNPRQFDSLVDELIAEIERLLLDEDVSWREIGDMLVEGELTEGSPRGTGAGRR